MATSRERVSKLGEDLVREVKDRWERVRGADALAYLDVDHLRFRKTTAMLILVVATTLSVVLYTLLMGWAYRNLEAATSSANVLGALSRSLPGLTSAPAPRAEEATVFGRLKHVIQGIRSEPDRSEAQSAPNVCSLSEATACGAQSANSQETDAGGSPAVISDQRAIRLFNAWLAHFAPGASEQSAESPSTSLTSDDERRLLWDALNGLAIFANDAYASEPTVVLLQRMAVKLGGNCGCTILPSTCEVATLQQKWLAAAIANAPFTRQESSGAAYLAAVHAVDQPDCVAAFRQLLSLMRSFIFGPPMSEPDSGLLQGLLTYYQVIGPQGWKSEAIKTTKETEQRGAQEKLVEVFMTGMISDIRADEMYVKLPCESFYCAASSNS